MEKATTPSKKTLRTYCIQTFGCAMNIADSERFKTILNSFDLKEVRTREEADLLIFNTCSVRQKAEDRIYGLRKQMEALKAENKNLGIILTGCMARRKFRENVTKNSKTEKTSGSREREIKNQAPWIDIVIETRNFHKIGEELKKNGVEHINLSKTDKIFNRIESDPFLNVQRTPTTGITAGITISHGCDHMCTFCIVPFARGREICRNYAPILQEAKEAIKSGTKDIVLLGQTVNRWINPDYKEEFINRSGIMTRIPGINQSSIKKEVNSEKTEPKDFLQLLQVIDSLEGDFWLSFISSHPNYFTTELINYIAKSIKSEGHIRPYIHLALQSGNNEILKRMRRDHTMEEFIEKVEYMRAIIPQVSISTDIIVGFPGETEEQFKDTLAVCERLKFDQIYISEYSERQGTGSSFMKDNVTQKEKTRRKNTINEVLKKTALKNNKKLIGTKQKCLILRKKIPKDRVYEGRTGQNKPIEIKFPVQQKKDLKIGDFIKVKIKSASPWSLSA